MNGNRTHCADCGTSNLAVPVQRVCVICETPQPRPRCRPCATSHAERNVHTGVELVQGADGPTYRKPAALAPT